MHCAILRGSIQDNVLIRAVQLCENIRMSVQQAA